MNIDKSFVCRYTLRGSTNDDQIRKRMFSYRPGSSWGGGTRRNSLIKNKSKGENGEQGPGALSGKMIEKLSTKSLSWYIDIVRYVNNKVTYAPQRYW